VLVWNTTGPSCSATLASHSHLLGLNGDVADVGDGRSECCDDSEGREDSEGRAG
jgi:hypothetical protein